MQKEKGKMKIYLVVSPRHQQRPEKLLTLLYEKRKYRSSVIALRSIERKRFVIIAWCMFQDEPAVFVQQSFFKYLARQFVDAGEGIRRTREYKIESFRAGIDELEDIRLHDLHMPELQFFRSSLNKSKHLRIFFHDRQVGYAAGSELITYTAGTAKEIERLQRFKIKFMLENVKQAFLGNIRGRACIGHIAGRVEFSPAMFTTYDAHRARSLSEVKKWAGYSPEGIFQPASRNSI